jgi:hypothetical protein
VALRETPCTTLFARLVESNGADSRGDEATDLVLAAELRAYFQLETPLAPLVESWAVADPRLRVSQNQ